MLTQILEDLYVEAKAKAGIKIIRKLKRGLRIELLVTNHDVVLTLSRDTAWPSPEEWMTILKHFPYYVEKVMPGPEQKNGRYTLSARLPSQKASQLKFL